MQDMRLLVKSQRREQMPPSSASVIAWESVLKDTPATNPSASFAPGAMITAVIKCGGLMRARMTKETPVMEVGA